LNERTGEWVKGERLACFPVPMFTNSPVLSLKIQILIIYLLHILGCSQGQEAKKECKALLLLPVPKAQWVFG
jgi:hypothetical protein